MKRLTSIALILSVHILFGVEVGYSQQPLTLTSGQRVDGEIKGGEEIAYLVDLKAGQFLSAELKDSTGDNAFKLFDPKGAEVLSSDMSSQFAIEPISYIATRSGRYKLIVVAEVFEATAKFSLGISVKKKAEANDLRRLKAEEAIRNANVLRATGEADKIRKSIAVLKESVKSWQILGDKYWEAHAQHGIGLSFLELKDFENALTYYGSALEIRRSIRYLKGQAVTTLGIASVARAQGRFDESIKLFRDAAALHHSSGNLLQEAAVRRDIGDLLRERKDYQKALEEYQSAASIAGQGGHHWYEALFHTLAADVLYTLNQTSALIAKREKAASIFSGLGDKESAAGEYQKIGWSYLEANEYAGAQQSFERAISALGPDAQQSAGAYWGLADMYRYKADMNSAISNYEKAASLNNSDENPGQSAAPLEYAGRLARDAGDMTKALAFFKRAMPFRQKANDAVALGNLHSEIGLIERALGNQPAAAAAFKEALIYQMSADDGKPLDVEKARPLVERALSRQKPAARPYEQDKILTVGTRISREVKAEDFTHEYHLRMEKGEFVHIELDQHNIDIVTTVIEEAGAELAKGDRPIGNEGVESLLFEAVASGDYRIRVRPLDTKQAGSYDLWVETLGKATDVDRKRFAAESLYREAIAEAAKAEEKSESDGEDAAKSLYDSARKKFIASRNIFRELGDLGGQEVLIQNLGGGDSNLRELIAIVRLANAHDSEFNWLKSYLSSKQSGWEKELSIKLAHELVFITDPANGLFKRDPKSRRSDALAGAARAYEFYGKVETAYGIWKKALELSRSEGNEEQAARVLTGIGSIFSYSDPDFASENFEEAAAIASKLGHHAFELNMFTNICTYQLNPTKALEFCDRALLSISDSRKTIGNKNAAGEFAHTYWQIGDAYLKIGNFSKAIESYQLGLKEKNADSLYGSLLFAGLGRTYTALGDTVKANEYFDAARQREAKLGTNLLTGMSESLLSDRAKLERERGDWAKAKEYYEAALVASRFSNSAYHDKSFQDAELIASIAEMNIKNGELELAIAKLLEAEDLIRNKPRKSALLHRVWADAMIAKKQFADAEGRYFSALSIYRSEANPSDEAEVLSELMRMSADLGKERLAVFYGKTAVNIYQQLRGNVRSLDTESRKQFAKSLEDTYRKLAEILIRTGRGAEAVEAIIAFKDQRAFDLSAEFQERTITLSAAEDLYVKQYSEIGGRVNKMALELIELKKAVRRQTKDVSSQSLQELERKLVEENAKISVLFKSAEGELGKSKTLENVSVLQVDTIQRSLLGSAAKTGKRTVAIYQIVGDRTLTNIVLTGHDIRLISTPIDRSVANERARKLWALLQSDMYDPAKASKEVYDIVFHPIEKERPDIERKLAGPIDTILWSLDGNFRYVPMGALYDGNQYLIQRYDHVNFTRADMERMTRPVSASWTATGLGTSKQHTVSLLGDSIPFSALPGVTAEFEQLFKTGGKSGLLDGAILCDDAKLCDKKFDQKAMVEQLKLKRPVVHIASHFSFRPGDEARSFLLLGDGTAFTLADMKKETNLFAGVELLTLSACNTAAQQSDANGKEIDGFAELAQRLGANSVMATLWPVADVSTPWLMREFYDGKINRKLSKAKSLREAQLALLRGSYESGPNAVNRNANSNPAKNIVVVTRDGTPPPKSTRGIEVYVNESDAPLYTRDNTKPFAHPYYWSPFVLFGNWQ